MFWYRRNPAVITQLPPQLFAVSRQAPEDGFPVPLAVGTPVTPDRMLPISNEFRGPVRPSGGLWTSTFLGDDVGSDWVRWSMRERGPSEWECHLLYPREARIFQVASMEDLQELYDNYPFETPIMRIMRENFNRMMSLPDAPPYPEDYNLEDFLAMHAQLDFEAIAGDFDAVHLTPQGLSDLKRNFSERLPWMHSWDCETVLWFRWCFDRVKYLGMRVFDPI